jgi:hypothetical protein
MVIIMLVVVKTQEQVPQIAYLVVLVEQVKHIMVVQEDRQNLLLLAVSTKVALAVPALADHPESEVLEAMEYAELLLTLPEVAVAVMVAAQTVQMLQLAPQVLVETMQ